jgi:hypothetical protein
MASAHGDHPAQPPTIIDEARMLWVSGVIHDRGFLRERGITVVIDLKADVDHGVPSLADNILYVYLPSHDGTLPNLDRLHAVVAMATSLTAVNLIREQRPGALYNVNFGHHLLDSRPS